MLTIFLKLLDLADPADERKYGRETQFHDSAFPFDLLVRQYAIHFWLLFEYSVTLVGLP